MWICVSFSPGKRLWKLPSQLYPLNWAPTDKALLNSKIIKSICSISAPETEQEFALDLRNPYYALRLSLQEIESLKVGETESEVPHKCNYFCWEEKIFYANVRGEGDLC